MRILRINQRGFKYQNYSGDPEPIRDVEGNLTGEYTSGYGDVLEGMANISPATGIVSPSYFGADRNYDRVIATDRDYGLDERSRLWIDDLNASRYDYVVRRVAKSINGILIAVSKVTNNG